MAKRRPVPRTIEVYLLFRSEHTCCICRIRNKHVQIHHIDRNPSNNKPDNLAVVCLDCHSQVTGRSGLGKAYSASEVRMYKRSWEQQVLQSRGVRRPALRYQRELISQIDLIVCEILAVEKNSPRIRELLNVLYEINLWRGNRDIRRKIVEGLHHLAIMSGLQPTPLARMVAEKLWELCWQYVGPKDVPMGKGDERMVVECVEALGSLAAFNCMSGHGRKAMPVIVNQLENFFEIGLWYSRKAIADAVLSAYEAAVKDCYWDGKVEFEYGRQRLRTSARQLQQLMGKQRPNWRRQQSRAARLLLL